MRRFNTNSLGGRIFNSTEEVRLDVKMLLVTITIILQMFRNLEEVAWKAHLDIKHVIFNYKERVEGILSEESRMFFENVGLRIGLTE